MNAAMKFGRLFILGLLLLASAPGVYAQGSIRYAKPSATGNGDCSSWANACTLQYALTSAAISGDEIWATAGTHKPTTGTNRSATFQLKNGVALYGGFAGTEAQRNERNWEVHVTVLSGDLGAASTASDNSYHVVTGSGTDSTAVLDGFTVQDGNATGELPDAWGGGMYNAGGSPTLANVTFSRNAAIALGGGMVNAGASHPTLTNVTFTDNSANSGGGMLNDTGSHPSLMNVTFTRNTAPSGGGMSNTHNSSPTLTNVTFDSNSSSDGGGMYNWGSSNPTLTNVTFIANSSGSGGGLHNYQSNPTLTNVTFIANSAYHGGGLHNDQSSPTLTNVTFDVNSAEWSGGGMTNFWGSKPVIRNVILWGNSSPRGPQIYNDAATPSINDSVIEGGCPFYSTCSNIITADPRLGTPGKYGGSTQTVPLLSGSSAVDAGNDATCASTDQRGVTRPQGAHCDIGAFEGILTQLSLPLIVR